MTMAQRYGIDYSNIESALKEKEKGTPSPESIFASIGQAAFNIFRKNIYIADYGDVMSMKYNKFPPSRKIITF